MPGRAFLLILLIALTAAGFADGVGLWASQSDPRVGFMAGSPLLCCSHSGAHTSLSMSPSKPAARSFQSMADSDGIGRRRKAGKASFFKGIVMTAMESDNPQASRDELQGKEALSGPPSSNEDLGAKTVFEPRADLKEQGMPVSGDENQLIRRLEGNTFKDSSSPPNKGNDHKAATSNKRTYLPEKTHPWRSPGLPPRGLLRESSKIEPNLCTDIYTRPGRDRPLKGNPQGQEEHDGDAKKMNRRQAKKMAAGSVADRSNATEGMEHEEYARIAYAAEARVGDKVCAQIRNHLWANDSEIYTFPKVSNHACICCFQNSFSPILD